jgi:GAF domain-containing protein
MKTMFRIIRSLLRLRYDYPNPIDNQQARGILWISWLAALSMFVGALLELTRWVPFSDVLYIASVPVIITEPTYVALYGLCMLGGFAVIVLVNRGSLSLGRFLYVTDIFIFGFMVYVFNGLLSVYVLALTLPLVAAGLLFSRRGGLITILFICMATFALVIFSQFGLIDVGLGEPIDLSDLAEIAMTVLFMNSVMLIVFSGGQRTLLMRNLALTGELRSLTTISQAIGSAASIDAILTQMVELTRDQLGYYHVQIYLVEEKTGVIMLSAGTGLSFGEGSLARRRIPPDDPSILNEVVRTSRSKSIAVTSTSERRPEFLVSTRSALLVPLRRGSQVLGVLDVQSIQPEAFTAQDITALEAIAAQIAVAVDNARLGGSLQGLNQERQSMTEQLRAANREIERLTQEISGRAWVHYLESRPDKLVGYDWREGAVTPSYNPVPLPEDVTLPRVETREGVQVLHVPVISRGQVLGMMEFSAPPEQIWDNRSLELARAIAQRLALSLDNLRLFEQAQMAVAREQMANQVATVLQTRSDVDSLVAIAVEAFQQALGATHTSIHLGTPESPDRPAPLKSNQNGGSES